MTKPDDILYGDTKTIKGPGSMEHNVPLTKREYFAAFALQGALASMMCMTEKRDHTGNITRDHDGRAYVRNAVAFADLLIAELNKEPK